MEYRHNHSLKKYSISIFNFPRMEDRHNHSLQHFDITSTRRWHQTNLLLADRLDGGRSASHKNSIFESAYDGGEVVRIDVGHLLTQGVLRSRQSQKATSSPVSLPSESTFPTTIPPPLTKDQQTPEGLPPKYLPTQTSLLLASSFLVRG